MSAEIHAAALIRLQVVTNAICLLLEAIDEAELSAEQRETLANALRITSVALEIAWGSGTEVPEELRGGIPVEQRHISGYLALG